MMRLSVLLSFSFLLSACNLSTPEQRAELGAKKVSYDLDLNDAQKAKLNIVKQAYLDMRKANEEDRKKQLEEVKQLILSDKVDTAKVKTLMAERQKINAKAFDSVFPKVVEFHSALDDTQKKKAVQMLEKFSVVF